MESRGVVAAEGQDALYNFLLAWQDGLNMMSSTRFDLAFTVDQLHQAKEKYSKHLADLELAAAKLDKMGTSGYGAEAEPSPELIERHELLTRKVAERQEQIKCVIDKLRTLQYEISILTTCTTPLEAFLMKT